MMPRDGCKLPDRPHWASPRGPWKAPARLSAVPVLCPPPVYRAWMRVRKSTFAPIARSSSHGRPNMQEILGA